MKSALAEVRFRFSEDLTLSSPLATVLAPFASCCAKPELINIVPKKANWDLKRDLESKMKELEHRTQLAIVDLISEWQHARPTPAHL